MWELPFGKDRRWMNTSGVANVLLGGWQMSGIVTLQDGFPFTVLCGGGTIQNGGGVCYPDPVEGQDWRLSRSERTRTRWFNTAAFVDRNPAGGPFRYGTVARNSLIGPGLVSVDASANKKFFIGDRHLELRVEVFNVPNLPIWGQPGNTLRTPNFGVINSTRLDSRQVQLGLKFVF
jgi:hypothetical protein